MSTVIIAPQLFSALGRLTANEQARVIDFIKTFQANPANPGVSLERIGRTKSKGLWSGRITRDLRAILHKDGDTWAMLHADHHDAAYGWAERREIGRHSVTGALQIVEAVESVREVERVIEVLVEPDAPPIFEPHADDYLLSLGVPDGWLPTLRSVKIDDHLLAVCEKLPEDVAERLLALAAGDFVTPPAPLALDRPAIESADTRRRFFVVEDAEGLVAALEAPMERWIAFLHPSQRELVEKTWNGPAKVSGSAGTGKTVVAMHRARHLARKGEKVLLTSYVTTLCENIEANLGKFCTQRERDHITVSTVHKQALAIVRQADPRIRPSSEEVIRELLDTQRIRHAADYEKGFIEAEWDNVVRLQGLNNWDEYRGARRTGRGKGLAVKERKQLWKVFGGVLEDLRSRNLPDWTGLCLRAIELLSDGRATSPFSAVVVDEVQDLRPSELRFLKALCSVKPGNLMLCGDTGQRIYPGGFSLSALGIEVRGRSSVLKINYRTTEQIRRLADRMIGEISDDMDGGEESRVGTKSLLRGPHPQLLGHGSKGDEATADVEQIRSWINGGLAPEDIAVFARTKRRVEAFTEVLSDSDLPWRLLSDNEPSATGAIQLGTMHRAKGLEFKAVLVMGCGDKDLPSPAVLRGMDDPQDRETAVARERRLLYVAMTRARDELTVTWTGKPSRFLSALVDGNDGGVT